MIIHSGVPLKGYCSDTGCRSFTTNHQYIEGHGHMQLDQVFHFSDSAFELFLYYGQVHKKKSSFTIEVPLSISFVSLSYAGFFHLVLSFLP